MNKFDIVKKHVDNYDFMGLIGDVGSLDEFDEESRLICEAIQDTDNVIDFAKKICEIFNSRFDRNDSHDEYIGVAMRIKEELDKVED